AVPGESTAQSREFLRAMAAAADDPALRWIAPDRPPPIERLAGTYSLSRLEVDLIVLAGLPEEHEGYAGILRTLHPASEPRPTAGLAAQLFGREPKDRRELRATLTSGTAVRSGILRLGGDGPLFDRSLLLADSLWPALHELDAWPASLRARREPVTDAGLSDWLEGPQTRAARAALEAAEPLNVLVTAETEEIAQHRAVALAAAAGVEAVTVVPKEEPSPELQQLIGAHAIARGVVPIVRPPAKEGPGGIEAPAFEDLPGPVILCGRFGGMIARGTRPVLEVRAERLTPTARHTLWRETVPELAGESVALAARYTIEPDTAAAAANDARAIARLESREVCLDDVAQGVRTRAGLAVSSGVRLIRPTATWDQL